MTWEYKILNVTVVLLLAAACDTNTLGPSDGGGKTHHVLYVVSGMASSALVTFQNENGDTSQQSDVGVPWTYSLDAEEGDFLYISAQNEGDVGYITCEILVDGQQVESNTSSGAYTICTASGSL